MENQELAKKMLEGIKKKKNSTSDLLTSIKQVRTSSLKEAIKEIQAQIYFREDLHKEMLSDIEKVKSDINNTMREMPNASIETQRASVEFQKKLIEADEMKINEKLNAFRDISLLKKELREILAEFREKESRASLLGDLID